jgi:hypothetical protein
MCIFFRKVKSCLSDWESLSFICQSHVGQTCQGAVTGLSGEGAFNSRVKQRFFSSQKWFTLGFWEADLHFRSIYQE